jgi:hypothetical protein
MQTIAAGCLWLKKYREHPDVFHKICQVAVAVIGLCYGRDPNQTERLGKLVIILKSADMHYFYSFLNLPKLIFYPIRAETLNQAATLSDLVEIGLDREVVRPILAAELAKMAGGIDPITGAYSAGYGYASEDEFLVALLNRIPTSPAGLTARNTLRNFLNPPVEENSDPRPSVVVLNRVSWLERITTVLGGVADIGVVFLFLNQWKLIDTARIGMSFGQIKGLSWVKNQVLDTWLWGTFCALHAINLKIALTKYFSAAEGSVDKKYAGRDAVVSVAELFFNGAWFIESAGVRTFPKPVLFGLALIAKGSGLVNIIAKLRDQNAVT